MKKSFVILCVWFWMFSSVSYGDWVKTDGTYGENIYCMAAKGNTIFAQDTIKNNYLKGVVACSAGNCCLNYRSDSIYENSTQVVVFKNKIYDIGGDNYNPATGNFTAPVDGIYNCSATVLLEYRGGTGGFIYLRLDKNDTYVTSTITNFSQQTGSEHVGLFLNMDVKLDAGDKVHFVIKNSTGAVFLVYVDDGDTRMSVHLVK